MRHINDPLLQAYIDGFCGETRVAEIEGHLVDCAECSARLERARGAAARASQLLGALEPGPIHEPSFEDLKERAVARSTEGSIDPAAALELARAATANVHKARAPLWRRPALAWAATVVIAFAVGWLMRSGIDLPSDLQSSARSAAQPQSPGGRFNEAGRGDAVAEPGGAVTGEQGGRAASAESDALRQRLAADERDDDSAAKATSADSATAPAVPAAASAPAPGHTGVEDPEVSNAVSEEMVARREAAATEEQRQAEAAEQEPLAVTGPPVNFSRSAQLGGILSDAEADVPEGFVVVDLTDVEPWLGAPPRELREAALLRAEVGPGALLDNGVSGHIAVRLIYRARGGEEIVLTQQYVGRSWRPTPADELPAVFSDPGGPVTYRWLDNGYLLSINAMLEPEVVRQIAGLVR